MLSFSVIASQGQPKDPVPVQADHEPEQPLLQDQAPEDPVQPDPDRILPDQDLGQPLQDQPGQGQCQALSGNCCFSSLGNGHKFHILEFQ